MKNGIMIVAGGILVLLGAIGLVIPVWPTTPFILLAVGCFSRAPRLRAKVLQIRFFAEYYESFHGGAGLPRATVTRALLFLWGMLALSMLLTRKLWLAVLLSGIGAAVTAHILVIARPNEEKQRRFSPIPPSDGGTSEHAADTHHSPTQADHGVDGE